MPGNEIRKPDGKNTRPEDNPVITRKDVESQLRIARGALEKAVRNGQDSRAAALRAQIEALEKKLREMK